MSQNCPSNPLIHSICSPTRWLSWLVVAAIVVTLALAFSSTRVEAAGEGIQVVNISHEIEFPGDIGFTLTAEGEEEIVEVELRYKPLNSDVWSYAYPHVEPGRRITTGFALNAVGADYLPPGAEIEFYYVIRDSAGNEHETEPEVIEYVDNRFDWQSTQIGPLTLLHHNQSPSRVTSVARSVEPKLEALATEVARGKRKKRRAMTGR